MAEVCQGYPSRCAATTCTHDGTVTPDGSVVHLLCFRSRYLGLSCSSLSLCCRHLHASHQVMLAGQFPCHWSSLPAWPWQLLRCDLRRVIPAVCVDRMG